MADFRSPKSPKGPSLPTGPVTAAQEADLLERAQKQDARALSLLLQAHQEGLRATIRALVGHPKDLEDILQEALLEAFTTLDQLPSQLPVASWLRGLAVQKSAEFLALQRRWRPAAHLHVQEYAETTQTVADVAATFSEEDFAYDARNNVAFCFTSVGRSLPLEEQLAVVLVDVLGVSLADAAQVQKINEDSLQRFLINGRTNLEILFSRLCGLSDEANPCHLCAGFQAVAAEERRGPDPTTLELDVGDNEARLRRRLKIVSDADLDRGPTHKLHDFLFELMQMNESNRETPKEQDDRLPSMRCRWEELQTFNN
jgi:RNA polymerase sigma-70 factor, ECF subfamily